MQRIKKQVILSDSNFGIKGVDLPYSTDLYGSFRCGAVLGEDFG
jgi:hypothetical protein